MSEATRAEAADAWRALVKRVREVYGDEDAEPWMDSFPAEIARIDQAIRADERSSAEAATTLARAEGVASGLRQARATIAKLAELGDAMAEGANDGFGSCSICADTPDHEEERDCPTVAWRAAVAALPEAAR